MKTKFILTTCMIGGVLSFVSCQKNLLTEPAAPALNGKMQNLSLTSLATYTGTLNVDTTNANVGTSVHSDFLGLSFETSSLTDPNYFVSTNSVLSNLFSNLHHGVIRFGGNTVDQTTYRDTLRGTSTSTTTLYRDDISRFAGFMSQFSAGHSNTLGVIFGLGIINGNPTLEATEANYVLSQFSPSSQLLNFEMGNEPDHYLSDTYTYTHYKNDFYTYTQTIKHSLGNTVPDSAFTGPANAYNHNYLNKFVEDTLKKNMGTRHYYYLSRSQVTGSQSILLPDPNLPGLCQFATKNQTSGALYTLPYGIRFGECNSVSGGGTPGVSDTFAASLWGTDFMFTCASNFIRGINFHTGNTTAYTAIAHSGSTFTAKPLYYSLMFFKIADPKQFKTNSLTFSGGATPNIQAYYFKRVDGKYAVLLANKEATDVNFTINNSTSVGTLTTYTLAAPSLTSTTGVNINGAAVNNSTGIFTNPSGVVSHPNTSAVNVTLSANTASLYILN